MEFELCILYFTQSEIKNYTEKSPDNHLKAKDEAREMMTDIHIGKMRNALIKHIYLQKVKGRRSTIAHVCL